MTREQENLRVLLLRNIRVAAWLVALCVFVSVRVFAQAVGTIDGTVTAPSIVVPNTTVKAIPHDQNKLAAICSLMEKNGVACQPTKNGTFTMNYLSPDSYDLVACPEERNIVQGNRAEDVYWPNHSEVELKPSERKIAMIKLLPAPSDKRQCQVPPPAGGRDYAKDGHLYANSGACERVRIFHIPTGCVVGYAITNRQGFYTSPADNGSTENYVGQVFNGFGIPTSMDRGFRCEEGPPATPEAHCHTQ
jgi:hypothetical protein